MISDRHIQTYIAGQNRITEALAHDHDDDLAHEGDDHRDEQKYELSADCKVDGCDRKRRTLGWCSSHYVQWWSTGKVPTVPFTLKGRFYKYVDKRAEDECWPWLGGISNDGYGRFSHPEADRRAHRASYEIHTGEIPTGLLIRHTCDNKVCVNPRHLLTGTIKDNARDAIERGLYRRGEGNGRAKLTADQVTEIRFASKRGVTGKALADRFGVSPEAVSAILRGRIWVGIGDHP